MAADIVSWNLACPAWVSAEGISISPGSCCGPGWFDFSYGPYVLYLFGI